MTTDSNKSIIKIKGMFIYQKVYVFYMITEIKDDIGEKLSDPQTSIEAPIFDEDESDIEIRISIGELRRVICPDGIKIFCFIP